MKERAGLKRYGTVLNGTGQAVTPMGRQQFNEEAVNWGLSLLAGDAPSRIGLRWARDSRFGAAASLVLVGGLAMDTA